MRFISGLFACAVCLPLCAFAGTAFDKSFDLQGVHFRVTCPNDSSMNNATIEVSGIENVKPIIREVDGEVVGAEVADLNADGFPEIYVYVTSAGSGSYGSVTAFASNKNKSLTEIFMPPLDKNHKASKGYMGHDEFSVIELTLDRRFPIYKKGDTNTAPTGGTRQVEYKLKHGEAGWVLKLDKFTDIAASS